MGKSGWFRKKMNEGKNEREDRNDRRHPLVSFHSHIQIHSPFLHLLEADITHPGGFVHSKMRQRGTFGRAQSTHTLTTVTTMMLQRRQKEK